LEQKAGCEVRGAAGVLTAAQHPQGAGGQAGHGYLDDVVGDQVGAGVGGVVFEAGAPVPHPGAVVGDQVAAPLALGGVVEVGPLRSLGPVTVTLAVGTAGLAPH
jgi:hypothetical protein